MTSKKLRIPDLHCQICYAVWGCHTAVWQVCNQKECTLPMQYLPLWLNSIHPICINPCTILTLSAVKCPSDLRVGKVCSGLPCIPHQTCIILHAKSCRNQKLYAWVIKKAPQCFSPLQCKMCLCIILGCCEILKAGVVLSIWLDCRCLIQEMQVTSA